MVIDAHAVRFPAAGHLLDMARSGHHLAGDGAGHPLLRARRAAHRLRDRGGGAAAPLRRQVGHPPGGGVGRPGPPGLLRGSRADTSRRALRPTRGRAVRADPRRPSERGGRDAPARDRPRASGGGPATVFACSCAGLAAARLASESPEEVQRLVFFGGYASRDDIPAATRDSLVDFVLANWQLAAQMLAGLFVPRGSGEEIAAAQSLPASFRGRGGRLRVPRPRPALGRRPYLPNVTAPALVLHRRGDRTVPIGRGRELASLLPNARFVALKGDSHLPWMDDQRDLQRALAGFLGDAGRRRRTATRRSAPARPTCCGSSPQASRTARSPRRSCSASTRFTATSRTSSGSSRSRRGPRPPLRRPAPAFI